MTYTWVLFTSLLALCLKLACICYACYACYAHEMKLWIVIKMVKREAIYYMCEFVWWAGGLYVHLKQINLKQRVRKREREKERETSTDNARQHSCLYSCIWATFKPKLIKRTQWWNAHTDKSSYCCLLSIHTQNNIKRGIFLLKKMSV